MDFGKFTFGSIEIDGEAHEHDVIIDRGKIHKPKKKVSRKFRELFGAYSTLARRGSPSGSNRNLSAQTLRRRCH